MAHGQKTFSTSGRNVAKSVGFAPLPPKVYDLKLTAKNFEVKVKEGPGNLPYLNGFLEALGTGGDSGKNRRVYHRFFLDLTPAKDGIAMVDRGAGLVALAKATGTEMDGVSIITKDKRLDNGTIEARDILNPKDVLSYLNSIDGAVFAGKVKVVPASGVYEPKNEIEYFVESENASSEDEDEDEDDEELDGEADDSDEDEDEDEDDEDEEEDVPAPKKSAKKTLTKKRR